MELLHLQRERQEQRQSLSPVLIKSVQLLSMPYPSLVSFLERYSVDNPFLELNTEPTIFGGPCDDESFASWEEGNWTGSRMDPTPLFHSADPMQSLREHLRLQLFSSGASRETMRAGRYIIDCIDDRGYFCGSLEETASAAHVREHAAREALRLVQTFTPRGVGASDLRECLLLQAEPERCDVAVLRAILDSPLERIERRDLRYYAKLCGKSVREIKAVFDYLSTLSPFPGDAFCQTEPIHYIYPEIEIMVQNGTLLFSIQSGCECVTVNEPLFESVSGSGAADRETREYAREKYGEAVMLVQELLLRRRAMETLVEFLVREQREYFLFPDGKLRPITMRQAAEAVGMNPSTISRCVSGRYIQTKDGVIPLKQLFSAGLFTNLETEVSPMEVKKVIRSWIEGESREHPISDQAIADRLNADGIQLSRRTVAKYREQLGIPGSRSRSRKGCFI